MDSPLPQKGLCGQMSIVKAKCIRASDKTAAGGISSAHQAKADPELAVLEEQDTCLKRAIAANKNRCDSSVFQRIGCDEIFGVGGEVVLLATLQAELTNLRQIL